MSWEDEQEWDAFINSYESGTHSQFVTPDKKKKFRSVKYEGPGHTIVTYPNRVLHIKFKQTPEEYEKAKKRRARARARKGAMNRRKYIPQFVSEEGMNLKQKRTYDKGKREINSKRVKNMDVYDMRAELKDARWDEISGSKRWLIDNKSTLREYEKYQKYIGGRL